MTQDKTMFDSAKWNTEPQIITINYNFSEKRVNDYFKALAHLLKRLHDDLVLCRFGGSMPKDNKFKAQITYIKEQTPTICERIYNEDKELMVETYDKIRRMKNNVLDILNDAPNCLIWKGGSLNQSLEDIEQNSKVYAETTPKSPLNTHSIIKTIDDVFNLLEAKVRELDKGHHSAVISDDIPTMENEFVEYEYPTEMLEAISKVLRCENIPMRLPLANDVIRWYKRRTDLKEGVRLAYLYIMLNEATKRTFYNAFFVVGLTTLRSESTISNIARTKPMDTTSQAELREIIKRYKL